MYASILLFKRDMSAARKNQSKQGYSADLNKYVGKKLKLRLNGGR